MTFIGDFNTYMKSRTDAPPIFHRHAAMAALATAMGNRVCCNGWSRDIYPNVWIVLIAPSGYGKSTSPDMAASLLKKAGLGERVLPTSFSYEAIMNSLAMKPVGIFELQEFAAFTGMLARDYMSGCTQFLTEAFDCPPVIERLLKSGNLKVEKPCLSILGGSSPEWFNDAFKSKDLNGGFYARFMFVPAFVSGPYVGIPEARDDGIETSLADHLRAVSELTGRFDLTTVRSLFNDWDKKMRRRAREDCPPEFAGMRSRATTMALKTAMIFHVSRDPYSLTITEDDTRNAIKHIESTYATSEQYLTEKVAHNPEESDRIRILDSLIRAGGFLVPWSDALKSSHLSSFKFTNCVTTLQAQGRATVSNIKSDSGRPTKAISVVGMNGRIESSPRVPLGSPKHP